MGNAQFVFDFVVSTLANHTTFSMVRCGGHIKQGGLSRLEKKKATKEQKTLPDYSTVPTTIAA